MKKGVILPFPNAGTRAERGAGAPSGLLFRKGCATGHRVRASTSRNPSPARDGGRHHDPVKPQAATAQAAADMGRPRRCIRTLSRHKTAAGSPPLRRRRRTAHVAALPQATESRKRKTKELQANRAENRSAGPLRTTDHAGGHDPPRPAVLPFRPCRKPLSETIRPADRRPAHTTKTPRRPF